MAFAAPIVERVVPPYMLQGDRYLANISDTSLTPWHIQSLGRVSRQPKEWDPYKWFIGQTVSPDQFQPLKPRNNPSDYWANNSQDPNWPGPNRTNEWNIRDRHYLNCFTRNNDYEGCNALHFNGRFPDSEMVWAEPSGVLK
jgi:hypothetical protein